MPVWFECPTTTTTSNRERSRASSPSSPSRCWSGVVSFVTTVAPEASLVTTATKRSRSQSRSPSARSLSASSWRDADLRGSRGSWALRMEVGAASESCPSLAKRGRPTRTAEASIWVCILTGLRGGYADAHVSALGQHEPKDLRELLRVARRCTSDASGVVEAGHRVAHPLPKSCPTPLDSRRLTRTSGESDPNPFRAEFLGVGVQGRVPLEDVANAARRVRIPPSPLRFAIRSRYFKPPRSALPVARSRANRSLPATWVALGRVFGRTTTSSSGYPGVEVFDRARRQSSAKTTTRPTSQDLDLCARVTLQPPESSDPEVGVGERSARSAPGSRAGRHVLACARWPAASRTNTEKHGVYGCLVSTSRYWNWIA